MLLNRLAFGIKNLFSKEVIRVFSLTAVSTGIKMITGFITLKVVAVIIGPEGMALVGQLSNFSVIIMTIASVGINNGVTKYVSEHKESPDKIRTYCSVAFQLTFVITTICALTMLCLPELWSKLVLHDSQYKRVFLVFGLTIILYSLNNLLMSVLNGYKEFRRYVVISIVSSITGLIFSVILVMWGGKEGALISMVTYQSIVFFVTLYLILKHPGFHLSIFLGRFDIKVLKQYLHYSLMTLISAATVPVSQLFLRSYAIDHLSIHEAGIWESMNRLSSSYLMVITSSFGVYFLPRLSELKEQKELRREIISAYKIIVPLMTIAFIFIYLMKDFIIAMLFSKEFYSVRDLFAWQLIGDIFKIMSWVLGILMVAKSKSLMYTFSEIAFSSTFVIMGIIFLRLSHGVVGLTQAYMINYILYFTFLLIAFKNLLLRRRLID